MDFNKVKDQFDEDWAIKFRPFIESEGFDKIFAYLKGRSALGKKICPEHKNLFRAFKLCPYKDLKCVFIGQDPYHQVKDGLYTADGLAFSCGITEKLQPSLSLFYDAIEDDLKDGLNLNYARTPDLSYLAKRGVLLANSCLTVEAGIPGSHATLEDGNIWEPLMKYMLNDVLISNSGLPIVLCGQQAQKLEKYTFPLSQYIIKVEHPAFAARQMRPWAHKGVFSQVNNILSRNNNAEIQWMKAIKEKVNI